MHIRVTDEEKESFKRIAKKYNVTLSDLVRLSLDYVDRKEPVLFIDPVEKKLDEAKETQH